MRTVEGRQLLGHGRRAEVYAWDDGTALRLYRSERGSSDALREADTMRAAAASGALVPRVHDVIEVEGRTGIVLDRVDGPDGFALLAQRPMAVGKVAATSARLHAQLVTVTAPTAIPDLKEKAWRGLASDRVPADVAAGARQVLETLPDGDALCHGDFHPGNILFGPDGPVVVDWEGAVRGHPEADHAYTLVLLAAGQPPPGMPLAVRLVIKVGRRVFRWAYTSEFRRQFAVDPERVRAWTGVLGAARLSEGIPEERDGLLALARRALSTTRRSR